MLCSMGTKKHSKASKARWAGVPKEERSRRMSELAKLRMKNKSPVERKAIAMSLVKARRKA